MARGGSPGALGHGNFLPWIEAEFGMSEDTAGRFMQVASRLADKIPHGAEFAPSVLYSLAAPNTPDEVREETLRRAAAGEGEPEHLPCLDQVVPLKINFQN